jgi:hypothetical protein
MRWRRSRKRGSRTGGKRGISYPKEEGTTLGRQVGSRQKSLAKLCTICALKVLKRNENFKMKRSLKGTSSL